MNKKKDFESIKNNLDVKETVYALKDTPAIEIVKNLLKIVCEYFPQYSIIPIITEGAGSILEKMLSNSINKKRQEFLEYISSSEETITNDMVMDEEFILEFANTLAAVDRLATNDKVKYIANLFKNTFCVKGKKNIDEYEEWLQNLITLSYREIEILVMLHDSQRELKMQLEIDPEEKIEKRNDFFRMVNYKFNLSNGEIEAILSSISRSGFCREEINSIPGYTGGDFYTTEYFEKFLSRIVK